MLTLVDVSKEIVQLYAKSQLLSKEIHAQLKIATACVRLFHGADLAIAYPSSVVSVCKGVFKVFYNDKFLRFYNPGDIISVSDSAALPYKIISEMATEIQILSTAEFVKIMGSDADLVEKWLRYTRYQTELAYGLCIAFIREDYKPAIDFRNFEESEVIIQEGAMPDCIFEMIDGTAQVTVKGTPVGTIGAGEVFGEISYLTASPRTASVVATSPCMVQVIRGADFDEIVKYRPALVYSMSRAIAKRLTEVNDRLVRIASLT